MYMYKTRKLLVLFYLYIYSSGKARKFTVRSAS